jgi:hypothetical protein
VKKRYTNHIAVALKAVSRVDISLLEEPAFPVTITTSNDAKFAKTNAASQKVSTWIARD